MGLNKSFLAFVVAFFALLFVFNQSIQKADTDLQLSKEQIIEELQKQSNLNEKILLSRVAVGYNTNLDLACNGVELMNKLGLKEDLPFQSSEIIDSLTQFGSSFGYFFQQGSAAERAASNLELWKSILEPLEADNYENCQILPGGNAALISNRLATLGVSVYLGGPVGNLLEPLLHPSIQTLQKFYEKQENLDPLPNTLDEIHLIMEFSTNEKWETIKSPRANRFIISHDIQNSQLSVLEEFHKNLNLFNPQVLIIAGSHLIEVLPKEQRTKRLEALANILDEIPSNVAIHLEIAGVGDLGFLNEMAKYLLPKVDSIGLNEQELGALYSTLGGTEYSKNDFVAPTIEIASNAIQFMMDLPFINHSNGKHGIGRIHLHYLSFHMISQRQNPNPNYFHWSKERASKAVAAGSLATTIQACGDDNKFPDISQVHTLHQFSNFKTSSMEFWVAPVAICNVPKRTVGLGDCISATGIAHHFQ